MFVFGVAARLTEVLPLAVRTAEAAHGDAADHVRRHQLPDGLTLLPSKGHPHVVERPLLRAQGRHLKTVGQSAQTELQTSADRYVGQEDAADDKFKKKRTTCR